MKKIAQGYYSPTPVFWRKIGDFSLILIPAVHIALASAPGMGEITRYWTVFMCDVLLLGVKFWTNTKKVHA